MTNLCPRIILEVFAFCCCSGKLRRYTAFPVIGSYRYNFSSIHRDLSSLCFAKDIRECLLKGDWRHFLVLVRETEAPINEVMDSRPPEDQVQLEHLPSMPPTTASYRKLQLGERDRELSLLEVLLQKGRGSLPWRSIQKIPLQ